MIFSTITKLLRLHICLFLCIAGVCMSNAGFSQEFIHYTQDNGLPSNKVYMVTLDKDGFIWCATDRGIAMYNGENFTTYTTKNGLPLNDIWKLYYTDDGKMWYFGRSRELGYIQNGKVYRFPSEDGNVMNPTRYFFYGKSVGFFDTFCSFYLLNGTWRKLCLDPQKENIARERYDNRGWISFFGNPIIDRIILGLKNRMIVLNNNLDIISSFSIPEINVAGQGIFIEREYFYLLADHIFYQYNINAHTLRIIDLEKDLQQGKLQDVYFFFENGSIILNGANGKYKLQEGHFIQLIKPFASMESIAKGYFEDNGGNVWINTFNDGIYKYATYNNSTTLFMGQDVQKLRHWNGELHAAIENSGLYTINTDLTSKFIGLDSLYFYQLDSLGSDSLKILTDRDFCFYDGTVFRRQSHRGLAYMVGLKINAFHNLTSCKYLFNDGEDFYAAASNFFVAYVKGKTIIHQRRPGIYSIEKYKDHIILGTTSGPKLFWHNNFIDINYLNNISITTLVRYKDYLLVGTDGYGAYFYKEGLHKISSTDGLIIYHFSLCDNNSVWLSSNFGAHELLDAGDRLVPGRSILRSNGLISNIVNDIVVLNDSIYCATDKGLCILNLNALRLKDNPNIIFTSISVNDSIYQRHSKIVVTNKGNNVINLNFDITYLNEHKQLKNYYKIEPISSNWEHLNSKNLSLGGLKPGEYTIRIRTLGYNGNFDEESISIVIKPRWFERTEFIVVMSLLGFGVVILVVFLVASSIIKKRNSRYKAENKLINMELYALRSKLNPHFIFNTFNSIQLFINNNEKELSEKYLVLLSKHIRNVFDYSHLQSITLEKEIGLLKDYLDIEKIRFGEKIFIEIIVDPRINIKNTYIPSMILQPHAENSLAHGLFHKEGRGHLIIEFNYVDNKTYQVKIVDDGTGFVDKESDKISSTQVIKERINLINQTGEFFIKKEKTYLDENKKDKGTIIILTIRHEQ